MLRRQEGFSLIEILVALFLMTLIFNFVTNVNFTDRQALEEVSNNVERAIRFAANETAIRNVIVRMHFKMGGDKQDYTVEYGPDGQFVIPMKRDTSIVLSEAEEAEELKKQEEVNKKFNKVRELSDDRIALPKQVRMIAATSLKANEFYQGDEFSWYFFPNGEKDEGMAFFATETEVLGIGIEAFTSNVQKVYRPVPNDPDDQRVELVERQDRLAKEMYEEWKGNRIQ